MAIALPRIQRVVGCFPPGVPLIHDGVVVRRGWRVAVWIDEQPDHHVSPFGAPLEWHEVEARQVGLQLARLSLTTRAWFLDVLTDQINVLHTQAAEGSAAAEAERDDCVALAAELKALEVPPVAPKAPPAAQRPTHGRVTRPLGRDRR